MCVEYEGVTGGGGIYERVVGGGQFFHLSVRPSLVQICILRERK